MLFLVGDKARPDVGVENDDALFMLARHQRFIGRAAGFRDKADRTELYGCHFIAQDRQVLNFELPASAILIIESISRLSFDEPDKCQCYWLRRDMDIGRANIVCGQAVLKQVAEEIGRYPGKQSSRDTKPPQSNSRVENGATHIGGKGGFTGIGFPR